MQKIIISPDSFKECMSALRTSEVIKETIEKIYPHWSVGILPLADGGEGTAEVFKFALGGHYIEQIVCDPTGKKIKAKFLLSNDHKTAVVEMAEASGLALVDRKNRNPLITTSFGTGELIKAALKYPIEELIITIGGSATNDAGVGMLQALGAKFLDLDNHNIGFGGGELHKIMEVNLDGLIPEINKVKIKVACDVENTLLGKNGATYVFGPQKGATGEMLTILERNLTHFASKIKKLSKHEIHNIPGSGAAGGVGASLLLMGCKLQSGIDIVLDVLNFEEKIKGATLIITGEGKIDNQTPNGKVISGVVRRASNYNIPVIAFTGSIEPGYEILYESGLIGAFSISPGPGTLESALKNGEENLIHTVRNIMRLISFRQVSVNE